LLPNFAEPLLRQAFEAAAPHIDMSTGVSLASLILALGAVAASVLSARGSRKSKEEREAAAQQQQREADRLEAEEERISVNAAREAVRIVREERNEAREEAKELRRVVDSQQRRIVRQNRIIRRQNVRIELQQEQISTLHRSMTAAGIPVADLRTPPDEDLWPIVDDDFDSDDELDDNERDT